jgi:capsular polysaccharide biosynthesis protein
MSSGISKEQFVVQLHRGRYWGRSYGYIINSKDYLHTDISPDLADLSLERPDPKRHDAVLQPFLPKVKHVSGNIAALNTLQFANFHHWLLDCIPKFGLIKKAGIDFSSIDYFILPRPFFQWHREVLEYLNIPLNKIISSTDKLHIRADNLIAPSFSEPSRQPHRYNYTIEGLMFVRDLLLSRSAPSCQYPERIIISRERTKCRRLIDGNQIASRLELYGFKKVFLEDHTLAEQARIFNSAKTIIMPTGGGLANLAFCQPGTKVIELFSPFYLPTFSLPLTNSLELDYIALVGESREKKAKHSDLGASYDIKVSLERILEYAQDKI